MMKKTIFLPVLCILFTGMAVFSACDAFPSAQEKERTGVCVHTFGAWEETAPTCTENGVRTRVCTSCGETQSVVLEAVGHDFRETEREDASCETAGHIERTCTRCGESAVEELPPCGHKWGEPIVRTSPTCTESGEYCTVCELCGAEQDGEEIPASGHAIQETVKKPATCTETGVKEISCTRCGETREETIPLAEHKWSSVREIEQATCTRDGLRCAQCEVCGKREEEQTVPALGHEWKNGTYVAPGCTAAGSLEKQCSRCGAKETENIPAAGHQEDLPRTIKEATCTDAGVSAVFCKTCGEKLRETDIPMLPHTYGEWTRTLDPTCTEPGKEEHSCDVCGKTESQSVEPIGHRYDQNFTIDVEPTRDSYGSMSRHCLNKNCDSRTEQTSIDPLPKETTYTVRLRTTSGGSLPTDSPIRVSFCTQSGEEAGGMYGMNVSLTLPTDHYNVKVSGAPFGYSVPKESYPVSPARPELEIRLPARMIETEANANIPPALKYHIGSVMYDMEVTVVGLTQEQDKRMRLSEIFSEYKAVFINMYFTTCAACVSEMPAFVAAYHSLSPNGKPYGEEVACILFSDVRNSLEDARRFKNATNCDLKGFPGETELPMFVLYDAWLRAYFTRELVTAFPTSILVDCEGVIVERHVGSMNKQGFINMMQRGIDRYETIHAWRVSEGLDEEETDPVSLLRTPPTLPADKRRYL